MVEQKQTFTKRGSHLFVGTRLVESGLETKLKLPGQVGNLLNGPALPSRGGPHANAKEN